MLQDFHYSITFYHKVNELYSQWETIYLHIKYLILIYIFFFKQGDLEISKNTIEKP